MCELIIDKRESILPVNEADWLYRRTKDVTSTEISSLFNESPYLTHAELYFAKLNGETPEFERNERMVWGTRLQNAIAFGIGEDQGWKVTPLPNYMRLPDAKMGASFDFMAELPDGSVALLEIKNVDGLAFKQGWVETDFGLEAPSHIEIQVQAQMHVSGIKVCYIGALIGGNRVVLLKRDYDPVVGKSLEAACRKFWRDVENNTPPKFDFVRDADLISAIYSESTKGKTLLATDEVENVMREYSEAAARASEADDIKKAKRAELLTLIGDAEKVVGQGYTASCGIVNKKEYTVPASSYRNVRIYQKKEKAA